MLLKHKYICLRYPNIAPCILRVDKIVSMREMPGNKTEITYADGRIIMVRESKAEIEEMISEEEPCAVNT